MTPAEACTPLSIAAGRPIPLQSNFRMILFMELGRPRGARRAVIWRAVKREMTQCGSCPRTHGCPVGEVRVSCKAPQCLRLGTIRAFADIDLQ